MAGAASVVSPIVPASDDDMALMVVMATASLMPRNECPLVGYWLHHLFGIN